MITRKDMKNREPDTRWLQTHTKTKIKKKKIEEEKNNANDGVLFTNNIFTPCLDAKNKSKICTIFTEKNNNPATNDQKPECEQTKMKKNKKKRDTKEMRLNKLYNVQN